MEDLAAALVKASATILVVPMSLIQMLLCFTSWRIPFVLRSMCQVLGFAPNFLTLSCIQAFVVNEMLIQEFFLEVVFVHHEAFIQVGIVDEMIGSVHLDVPDFREESFQPNSFVKGVNWRIEFSFG
jgi:hypothetical protein